MQPRSEALRRLNRLLSQINQAYQEATRKLRLSDSEMQILYGICDAGGVCPLAQVIRESGLPKQTVNSALRKMEADGTLQLENLDGRSKGIRLTQKGSARARATVGQLMRMESEIFAQWPPEQTQAYLGMVERYLGDFTARLPELKRGTEDEA